MLWKRWPVLCCLVLPLSLTACSLQPQAAPSTSPTSIVAANAPPTQTDVAPASVTVAPDVTVVPDATAVALGVTRTVIAPTLTTVSTATPSASPSGTPTIAPTPIIRAPVHLTETEQQGGPLLARYWTNTNAIIFRFAAAAGTTPGMRPQIELEPLAKAFVGIPTSIGAPLLPNSPGSVTIRVSTLPEGPYHWQARLGDNAGHTGPWVDFYNGPAFRIDRTPPPAPSITSTTDPNQHAAYAAPMAKVAWTTPQDKGGIQGYLIGVDRKPQGEPHGPISSSNTTVLGPLANGAIYFHVRAVDWAGNRGAVATYALHIDHRPPILAHAYFERFQFNPQYDQLTMHFVPNKTVHIVAHVLRQTTKGLVREIDLGRVAKGTKVTLRWDGRNARGVLVRPGKYTLIVYVTDALGNVGDGYYADLGVNYRRMIVHLAAQRIDFFDGETLLRSTLVTTGNQHLPTPIGVWHVLAKFHPYKFISPWKKGSVYYYPTTPVSYALNFHPGGYFLHDAPWRSIFGPGTNSSPGLPGSGVYSGSHGCVEMTTDEAKWMYNWAQIGTVVQVVK